ncbi:MAG: transposase [Acidobacteria bacterium]|nr:transposase [Acidobacteriota bacterium]MYI38910.1 transposase [Acidobacteriota bacterium]
MRRSHVSLSGYVTYRCDGRTGGESRQRTGAPHRSCGSRYDNAMAESFFATLECEVIERTRFANPKAAGDAVFEFIEAWYNPHRRHSALGYLSPVDFEQQLRGPE